MLVHQRVKHVPNHQAVMGYAQHPRYSSCDSSVKGAAAGWAANAKHMIIMSRKRIVSTYLANK